MAAIEFPVVVFGQGWALIVPDWKTLTTTTRVGLKKGEYDDAMLVDSAGNAVRIRGAREMQRIKPLWGSRLLSVFNPWIRVELQFEGEPHEIPVMQLRQRLFRSFQEWHGWSSGGDVHQLQQAVQGAESAKEIVELVLRWSKQGKL